MNIIERLSVVLSEAGVGSKIPGPKEPQIIDIKDQGERSAALRNCRGPCVGWSDYAAGNDYQPPMFFTSDVPYGPKDTGKRGIISSHKDAAELQFDGENPFSRKYGGVRPWHPGEVLLTFLTRTDDRSTTGQLWLIATKQSIQRASLATLGRWDETAVEEAVSLGASAALQVLKSGVDEARIGVRFTSFIGMFIEQGIRAGVPAGYGDEYRKARGLFNDMEKIARSSARRISAGDGTDAELLSLRRLFGSIDPEPSPSNPYGMLTPVLFQLKTELSDAITQGDLGKLEAAMVNMKQARDKMEEQEEQYYSPGITTGGAVMSKPRDFGAMGDYKRASELLKKFRVIATKASESIQAGKSVDKLIGQTEAVYDSPVPGSKKSWDTLAIAKPKGDFVGLRAIRDKLLENLQGANANDLDDFVGWVEVQQQILKHQEQVEARSIGGVPLDVKGKNSEKEVERTNFKSAARDVDALYSKENREMLETAIALISPWRDRRGEKVQKAKSALAEIGTFKKLLDAAKKAMHTKGGEYDDVVQALRRSLNGLNARRIGEYARELQLVGNGIAGAMRRGDTDELEEYGPELDSLAEAATQDQNAPDQPGQDEDSVTEKQYRLLLRLYGIKNYPERGTPDDPEIGEDGQLSRWAKAGYPALAGVEPGKKQQAYLWSDVFETIDPETGEPKQSISDVALGKHKLAARGKFEKLIAKLQRELVEEGRIDSIDYRMLSELRLRICNDLLEEALPGAGRLIFG